MAKRIIETEFPTPELIRFLTERHVITLASSNNDHPYCCNCFYAFQKTDNVFIFTSEKDTRHIKECLVNNKIAGSIYLDTKIIGKIRGIQFTGTVHEARGEKYKTYKLTYLKKFPYAITNLADLWYIKPDFIKFTDNRLGFGTKLLWRPVN